MSYEPKGKIKALLDAMAGDPRRVWSASEAAKVLGVPEFRSTLMAYTDSACRHQLMYRRLSSSGLEFRLIPLDGEAGQSTATGWTPPRMVPPRGTPAPAEGKREAKLEQIRADIAADMEPRGERANRVLVDKLQERLPHWKPEPTPEPTPEPAPAADASTPEVAGTEEPDPVTWTMWEDGDLDLFGLQEIDGGGHRMPAEALRRLRKFVAWMPA